MTIVFLGTPEFAVNSLDILIQNGYDVVGVVTAPDKPAGRGQQLQQSAVKKYAVSKGLHVLQPTNLKDAAFQEELCLLHADLFIVVAFRMLPEAVWQMPPFGTFNLHASLLPDYRGAAPINWAIINGEKETGVTTFFLKQEIDTGAIIFNERVAIEENDNAGTLHDKLKEAGAHLVLKTVSAIKSGMCPSIEQDALIPFGFAQASGAQAAGAQGSQPSTPFGVRVLSEAEAQPNYKRITTLHTAPKLTKQLCRIKWNRPVEDIYNHIRGLSPYPAAWTEVDYFTTEKHCITIKIFNSKQYRHSPAGRPGTIVTDKKSFLKVNADNGSIDITELQPAGKNKMSIKDFLNGYKPDHTWKMI